MTRSPLQCCTSIIRSSALVQASSSLSTGRTCAWPRSLPVTEMHFRHFSREFLSYPEKAKEIAYEDIPSLYVLPHTIPFLSTRQWRGSFLQIPSVLKKQEFVSKKLHKASKKKNQSALSAYSWHPPHPSRWVLNAWPKRYWKLLRCT